MPTYEVVWEIEIEADTPKQAAETALLIQRDPDSIATVFMIRKPVRGGFDIERIDLLSRTENPKFKD